MSLNLRPGLAVAGAAIALPVLLNRRRGETVPMDARARKDAPGSFVRLRHGTTHVMVDGPETGEPVLLIPGATLSLWVWDELFERLARAGYRTIRFDRYGLGFSDRPDISYDQPLFEEQMIDLLDALGVDRPVTLVALAFGGPIAAEFAVHHPERVAGVCLVSPDGFATPLSRGLRISMLPGIGLPFFRLTGNRALKSRLPGYSRDPRVVARVQARLLPELRYRGFKRSLLSALANVPFHGAEYLYRVLDAADVPVQVIWGRHDPITPMPPEDVLRSVFSHADLHLLEGVGHLPHFERPDETAALVLDFLHSNP
ncbi:alpha/beta fold hydrolase [Actinomadura rupiterrae]|uniref:alpha/beta fold hydrolase n=1 Tax=Actinomadura rupiterrae TaxID=559627 RepID=UPI0020A55D35|nr:alpha/beta hydrolase [Actinomadura rupiterrae]MCP2340685.1 pimeloyl-ACP methyl ester carboxylesterase [Actinomadura rupiterrae]